MRVKLGDIFEIGSGGTPSKSHPEYYGGDIPWVKTGDLKLEYLYEVEDFITEEGLKNSSAKMYEEDTVLIAMYGATIGATSILKMSACTNQACAAFKKNDRVIPEYLYYFLKSQKEKFVKDGVGGAQPNISAGYLKKVEMELPTLEEQRSIVDILDKTSNVVIMRNNEISSLDDLIKARFVEMFGDPIINEKGWETDKLSNVCPINKYKGDVESINGKVWLLNLDMVESNTGKVLDYLYEDENNITSSTIKFDTNCVLYSKLRPYLNKVVVPQKSGYATSEMLSMQTNTVNKYYLSTLLMMPSFVDFANGTAYGAKMPRASVDTIKSFDLMLPPVALQNEFETFVKRLDKSKFTVQAALDKAQLLFDSLMQEYFG